MKNKFFKKALSLLTAVAVAFSLMTGIPFSELDLGITASAATTEIDASSFAYGITSSGTGWTYNGSNLTISSGYELTVINGTFTATVYNNGTIEGGTFSGTVYNDSGIITGGTFEGAVNNSVTISGGVFNGTVTNQNSATISGGIFNGTVKNNSGCTIEGGSSTFSSTSAVENRGIISSGSFEGSVTNYNIISNGTFNGSVVNNGTINGGDFNNAVTNRGSVNGGDFTGATVSCIDNHHIEGTPATCHSQAVCNFCGQPYGSTAPHSFVDGVCSVSTCGAVAAVKYTCGGTTYYTDDFKAAVTDINNNGGGTITLRDNVSVSGDVAVMNDLVLNLGTYTLDLGTDTLGFVGSESSITGTGTITSAYDSMIPYSGEAVYVVNGASLAIGEENGDGPTITGGANAITTSNDAANKLTVYAGTFGGACHFDSDSTGDYNIIIKGGTFNDEVYADWTQIDGGVFKKNINCVNGSRIIINNCECEGSLKIGQANTAIKYVTLNGGVFEDGIENQTLDGKTTDYLGTDRYYIDEDGQIIEIPDASDLGYDIDEYVIIAPVHTVTFETNGYGGADFEEQVADGFTVAEPAELTDPDMNFGGWYKDSAVANAWNFTTDKVTSDITLYAKWTAIQQVETPVFTPVSGTEFEDSLSVTISCATDGATIYYTTDGTAPTTAGTKYTGAVTITADATINAIAVKTGMNDSETATASYRKKAAVTSVTTTTAETTTTTAPVTTPSINPTTTIIPVTTIPTVITTTTTIPVTTTTTTTTAITTTVTTTTVTTTVPEEEEEVIEEDDDKTDDNPETGVAVCFGGVIASAVAIIIAKKKAKYN